MPIERSFFVAAFACCLVTLSLATSMPTHANPALPGEPCGIPARDIWTEAENWAWKRICVGETADFNVRTGVTLDPKKSDGWSNDRKLSADFLETILLYEPYRSALTPNGVRLIGAWFTEPIELENARITAELWLDESRFEKRVSLRGVTDKSLLSLEGSSFASDLDMRSADFGGSINMAGCKFAGTITMELIEVGKNLMMPDNAEFKVVNLLGAKIGGQINMRDSKFAGTVNMETTEIGQHLLMSEKAEFQDVNLLGAKIGGQIDMRGSKFPGPVNMDTIEVTHNLLMHEKASFQDVILRGAKIGGQIDMRGSKFAGPVNMDTIEVTHNLLMREKASFQDVNLRGAKIGGQISITGSRFTGRLNMYSAEVGKDLFMGEGAEFGEVILQNAKIGGQIFMIRSKFTGGLAMGSTKVGGDVLARSSVFDENAEWSLVFAEIGSNLDLRRTIVTVLDLTGTRIGGELRLGTATLEDAQYWRKGSRMTLRNTEAGAVQDRRSSWPEMLELEGFTYRRLGGLGAEGEADIGKRNSAWFIEWLARDPTYSQQPYEHLAKVLRASGQGEKAGEVLYAGRERERLQLQKRLLAGDGSPEAWVDFVWKSALHAVIGYGYKVHRAFYWIAAFVILGTVFIWRSRQLTRHRIATGTAGTTPLEYSIDMLLPIIELRKQHYDIDLTGATRYYFYFHKLMGFVLVSFLIAGLAGLTK
jgi:uncharacterized protein YjbI with pentapeptide repeats